MQHTICLSNSCLFWHLCFLTSFKRPTFLSVDVPEGDVTSPHILLIRMKSFLSNSCLIFSLNQWGQSAKHTLLCYFGLIRLRTIDVLLRLRWTKNKWLINTWSECLQPVACCWGERKRLFFWAMTHNSDDLLILTSAGVVLDCWVWSSAAVLCTIWGLFTCLFLAQCYP